MRNENEIIAQIIITLIVVGSINCINNINSTLSSNKTFIPLEIKFIYDNLGIKNQFIKESILTELKQINSYFNSMFYIEKPSNNKTFIFSSKNLIKCSEKYYDISKYYKNHKIKRDSVIIIVYKRKTKEKYFNIKGGICTNSKNGPKIGSIFLINTHKAQKSKYIKNIEFYRWKLVRIILDILSVNKYKFKTKIQLGKMFLTNSTLEKDNYYWSWKKFSSLTQRRISPNVFFKYYQNIHNKNIRWPDMFNFFDIMKHSFSKKESPLYSITEMTINAFNDITRYKISRCDLEFISNKCFREKYDCVKNQTYYFMEYSIDNKNKKIICYLNDINNIEQNKCGIKYGNLLNNEHFLKRKYTFNYLLRNITSFAQMNPNLEFNELPELSWKETQDIYLLQPSSKCPNKHPRTVFFVEPEYNEYLKQLKNLPIKKVTLTDKKYFLIFGSGISCGPCKYTLYENDFIQSSQIWNNFNIFWCRFKRHEYDDIEKKLDEHPIGQYQFMSCLRNSAFLKDGLYKYYKIMKTKFPDDYNYMSESYSFPDDKDIIEEKFKNYDFKNNFWLYKPPDMFQGQGIYLINSYKDLKTHFNEKFLLCKYISNPLLLYKKKFDIRSYLLVTGLNPLKLYFYNEGYLRIASYPFTTDKSQISNKFIHLTGSGINKAPGGNYKLCRHINDEEASCWRLGLFKSYCERNNIDYSKIKEQIKDIMIKTILLKYKVFDEKLKEKNILERNIFHIYGLDILINEDLKAHLLEINSAPEIEFSHPAKNYIFKHLLPDTLNIVGLVPYAHDETNEPFDKDVYKYNDKVQEAVDEALCEFERPLGFYERIFPLKNNIDKYKKYFDEISPENKILWEKMTKE